MPPGSVRNGTLPGATAIQMPSPTSASANTIVSRSPTGSTFSAKITAATITIHVRLITPTAKSTSISAQQQPTHQSPCSTPIRSAPSAPPCQRCSTKWNGVRQWRRQICFIGVSW